MSSWCKRISVKPLHPRALTSLPGDGDTVSLPIQKAIKELWELIERSAVSGVRSPPGSGKTMILPELLLEWWPSDWRWHSPSVVIVLPTQYAAQKKFGVPPLARSETPLDHRRG